MSTVQIKIHSISTLAEQICPLLRGEFTRVQRILLDHLIQHYDGRNLKAFSTRDFISLGSIEEMSIKLSPGPLPCIIIQFPEGRGGGGGFANPGVLRSQIQSVS